MTNHPIRGNRVRELIELLGEAGEVDAERRRQHVLEGMCRLLGASAAVMVRAEEYFPGGRNRVTHVFATGWTGRERTAYLASIVASACGDPVLVPLGMRTGQRAYRRRDLVSDREWYEAPWVCDELRAAHLDDAIYAARPIEGSSTTECIGIYRPPGDRDFTEEDREIVHLLSLEGRRLFEPRVSSAVVEAMRGLPRRQAETLERLCLGKSEKEIGYELGISRNTVHVYVKALYRLFGVASRAELLVRCIGQTE